MLKRVFYGQYSIRNPEIIKFVMNVDIERGLLCYFNSSQSVRNFTGLFLF